MERSPYPLGLYIKSRITFFLKRVYQHPHHRKVHWRKLLMSSSEWIKQNNLWIILESSPIIRNCKISRSSIARIIIKTSNLTVIKQLKKCSLENSCMIDYIKMVEDANNPSDSKNMYQWQSNSHSASLRPILAVTSQRHNWRNAKEYANILIHSLFRKSNQSINLLLDRLTKRFIKEQ
jgi:hypothetical protein